MERDITPPAHRSALSTCCAVSSSWLSLRKSPHHLQADGQFTRALGSGMLICGKPNAIQHCRVDGPVVSSPKGATMPQLAPSMASS